MADRVENWQVNLDDGAGRAVRAVGGAEGALSPR